MENGDFNGQHTFSDYWYCFVAADGVFFHNSFATYIRILYEQATAQTPKVRGSKQKQSTQPE